MAIARQALADRLSEEIGAGKVRAALFSTFTFGREFFEKVPLSLISNDGEWRGRFPVTVIVDRSQFGGQGWGYEIVRPPGDRLWHAKVVALAVRGPGPEMSRSTVLAIGSGNLTRSGWEQNQELFHVSAWPGWALPEAIQEWLREPWLRDSMFGRWTREEGIATVPRNQRMRIVSSLKKPIWQRIEASNRGFEWNEAHVVAPFSDVDNDDALRGHQGRKFFTTLLEGARPNPKARLTVYLRGMEEEGNAAQGDPKVFEKLRKRKEIELNLRVVRPAGDRFLHAKLLALRSGRRWWVVVGSPNATGPGMIDPNGNVELALEFRNIGNGLPRGLLPKSYGIFLQDIKRPIQRRVRRWLALESAEYKPTKMENRLILKWIRNHGVDDTRVFLGDQELDPKELDLNNARVSLSKIQERAVKQERTLKTVPRSSTATHYEPGFVPIQMSADELNLPGLDDEERTADGWLELLDGGSALTLLQHDVGTGISGAKRLGRRGEKSEEPFAWKKRVKDLMIILRGFQSQIARADSKQEVEYLRSIVVKTWDAHDPEDQ
ncbi:MAG: hypothetical protein HY278_06135, partial [candidate division NC10 bacterium]|nr:hypothetical protein [candidate division NC10 bacterium]